MSLIESPKLIIVLFLIAIGSSGYSLVNSTDSVDLTDLENKQNIIEVETQRRLDDMDRKIQIEMRLIAAPLENEVQNLKDIVMNQRDRISELEQRVATLLERTK